MRAVCPAVAAVLVSASVLFAQPAVPGAIPAPKSLPAPTPLPPIPQVPAAELPAAAPEPVLPGGTEVSQPLQPSTPPPPEPKPEVSHPTPPKPCPPPGPLGSDWDNLELLIWWPKAQPVPPLVVGTRPGTSPLPVNPHPITAIGGRAVGNPDFEGGRFTLGWPVTNDQTVGIEGTYFFLGTRTIGETVSSLPGSPYRSLGMPYLNPLTGAPDTVVVARPGLSDAFIDVSTTSRLQGAEMNLVANLAATQSVKVNALAGYRYFQLQEGLRVEQRWLQYPAADGYKTFGMIADQFDTANRFNGGQVGMSVDLRRGSFFVEMVGKVALGSNFEVVKTDGATHLITANYPVPLYRSFQGGVYALPSNLGRVTNSAFAVLPEALIKFGFRLNERGRFYVGYNFLYLSDAVRPGDQIDRTLNPTQIPLLNPGGGQVASVDRPRLVVNRTDFWVQGVVIGLETRY
jgi:hypothetical protein